MKKQNRRLALATALTIALASVASVAQQPLDRTKIPTPGPNPVLRVPTWTKTQLPNGALLIVSEKHNLPLVSNNQNHFSRISDLQLLNWAV